MSTQELDLLSREQGRSCPQPGSPPLKCNAVVATWARGSEVSYFILYSITGYSFFFIFKNRNAQNFMKNTILIKTILKYFIQVYTSFLPSCST